MPMRTGDWLMEVSSGEAQEEAKTATSKYKPGRVMGCLMEKNPAHFSALNEATQSLGARRASKRLFSSCGAVRSKAG
ncbi:MAG: hypothetical protein JWM59_3323 [Verrucomicrobiales bacterium]|nr:hypothetical protein [Verrucomicrobiales bacterium]